MPGVIAFVFPWGVGHAYRRSCLQAGGGKVQFWFWLVLGRFLMPCLAKINSDYKLDCTTRLYVP